MFAVRLCVLPLLRYSTEKVSDGEMEIKDV